MRRDSEAWPQHFGTLVIPGDVFWYRFTSDNDNVDWGYSFEATAMSKASAP